MSKFSKIFSDKNFFCFWFGQIISQFGDRLNQMALIALVYQRTGLSAFGLAKVMSLTIIPSFLISPFAGAYVDRWNHKYTMIITDIIRAVLVLMIPLFFLNLKSPFWLYITIFLIFSTSCFFLPSKFSIIPEIVDKEKLLIANSLTNTTMMVAAVFGFGLGGPLIEKVGAKTGFYLDSMTFVISAVLLSFLRLKYKRTAAPPESQDQKASEFLPKPKSIFKDIIEGIKYVFNNPYLRFVFSTIFMLMAAAGSLYTVGIVFIQKIFGSVTRALGVLSVFLGVGVFLGAIIYGRFGQKISRVKMIFLCMILVGIFIGCFALALTHYASMPLAMVICVLIGFVIGPIFISGNTLIHEVIKAHMRGRIFSSLGIIMNLGLLLFMFASSRLSEFYRPVWVILAISVCFIFYGIFGFIRVKSKR